MGVVGLDKTGYVADCDVLLEDKKMGELQCVGSCPNTWHKQVNCFCEDHSRRRL